MNFRNISLAAATIAVFAPSMSQATPERDGFKACASAFASSLASPSGVVPTFKADYLANRSTGSTLDFFTREYAFDMRANDQKTGAVIARAHCSTDTHGTVLTLSPVPLNVEQAALAAQL